MNANYVVLAQKQQSLRAAPIWAVVEEIDARTADEAYAKKTKEGVLYCRVGPKRGDDEPLLDMGEVVDFLAKQPDAQEQPRAQCGRLMVGSGPDTYDPICELEPGHRGPCKSSAAIDQHRLS